MAGMTGNTLKQAAGVGAPVENRERERWLQRIRREEQAHKPFRDKAAEAMREYESKNREDTNQPVLYPIFWANTQITSAAIFNRLPKPEVRRRYAKPPAQNPQPGPEQGGAQPVPQTMGNSDSQIAMAVERCIEYQLDMGPYSDHWTRAVTEFLVAGLGVDLLYLDTKTTERPAISPIDGSPLMEEAEEPGEDGEPVMVEVMEKIIVSQSVMPEYVPYVNFHWEPVKDWEDVTWIAVDIFMSGSKINEEFGVDVAGSKTSGSLSSDSTQQKLRAQVYTQQFRIIKVWNKKRRQIVWLAPDFPELFRIDDDALGLEGFFPCARPMIMDVVSGELIPQPEYSRIRNLCDEINRLTGRIKSIVEQIKARGYYDPTMVDELSKLVQVDDNAFVPVNALAMKLKDSGMASPVLWDSNDDRVATVAALTQERERAKAELYEITGIADIVRGASQASETASAQALKGQWANVRLSRKQQAVQSHYRDTFRIMAEIIAEHFDPVQIAQQSGIELTPEQQETIRSDLSRCYAIDVETDSTIAQDEAQEKSDRLEFLQQFTPFIQNFIPAMQGGQMPADLGMAVLKFALAAFPRAGRTFEDVIETLPNSMQQLSQMQQQTQELQQQLEQAQAQNAELQKQLQSIDQAKMQADMAKAQADATKVGNDQQRVMTEAQRAQAQNELDNARTMEIMDRVMTPDVVDVAVVAPAGIRRQ